MKPILFLDFDGTLCHDKYWRSLPSDQYSKIQELIFGSDRTRLKDWMIGKYSAEEVNRFLAEELEVPFKNLWELFVRDCKNMEVSKNTLEKISSLRERYMTILITGNMDSFNRFTVPSLHLDMYFDHINNSFFEGKHKSDNNGELFSIYAQVLNAPIGACVLIDDSAKNCQVFSSLGGTAYRITPEHNVDFYLDLLG